MNTDSLNQVNSDVVNIVVVDDTKASRDLVRQALAGNQQYKILDDFEIPSEFKKFLSQTPAKSHPDVVVLDIGFNFASTLNSQEISSQEGLEFLSYLVNNYPKIKVIMFSYHNNIKQYVKDAFIKGARGYISKNDGFKIDLINAILAITRKDNPQGFYKSPDIPEEWVEEARHELRHKKVLLKDVLTETQWRVFLGIAKGFTKNKIIDSKACAKNAFDAHTSNIRLKLGLEHNWQIPGYAIKHKVKEVLDYYEKKEQLRIV